MKRKSLVIGLLFFLSFFCLAASSVVRKEQHFLEKVFFAEDVTFESPSVIKGTPVFSVAPQTTVDVGAGVTGASAVEYAGVVHKTILTVDKDISLTDVAGTGAYGSFKVYDFPKGYINILGAVVDLSASGVGGGGLVAAADGDFSVGSVVCNSGGLSSTEANIIASTALTQFASTAGVISGLNAAAVYLDGTATPVDIVLNVIFDDADSSANSVLGVDGTITITWTNLSDK